MFSLSESLGMGWLSSDRPTTQCYSNITTVARVPWPTCDSRWNWPPNNSSRLRILTNPKPPYGRTSVIEVATSKPWPQSETATLRRRLPRKPRRLLLLPQRI